LVTLERPASAQFTAVRPPDGPSPAQLTEEIENAAANELFAVELRLARSAPVGEIRAVSSQLGLPRVLAQVEYGHDAASQPRGIAILGLGEMYASGAARQYSECRALLAVSFNENQLRDLPIDEWLVSKFHVYATAHVIRELLSGKRLPAATILGGSAAKPEHLDKVEEYVRDEIAQPIQQPQNVVLPPYCSKFVGPADASTLSADFPLEFQPPQALAAEDFRQYAFRLLAQLPRNAAVTIQLKLSFPANVELLGSLVRDYEIRGMQADLVPERSTQRMIGVAELSARGDLNAQLHRARCQMRLGGVEPQASSEWHADWITASLSAENAVRFLSYPNLAQARVAGSHPLADLDRLDGYFERLAGRIYRMPRSIEIPRDCGDVYVYDDSAGAGSFGVAIDNGR
jgi:hypothetical protein